jgi:hypothetical protein
MKMNHIEHDQDVLLTPQLAKELLKNNRINRVVRPSRVAELVQLIKGGEFRKTHQGLAVDWNGQLQDGQHRCLAVIQTGIPVRVKITYNVDPANYDAIDRGAHRNAGDILRAPSREAGVVRAAVRLVCGSQGVTPARLHVFEQFMGQAIKDLVKDTGCSKVFSTQTMKLAAVTTILMGGDFDYVKHIYANLCRSNLDELPPVAKGMVQQYLRGHLNTSDGADMLARGMTVFNKRSANTTRVQVKDPGVTVEKVRAFYRSLVPELKGD